MRLVQVTVPTGKRDAVVDALDDEDVDYIVTDETSGREYTAVVYAPLPKAAVEPVLDRLQDAGVGEEAYTVVVEANIVISRKFEQLKDKYAEHDDEERIGREELEARARDLTPTLETYVTMTVVSAIIATAGLLLDSPAVVVGSMVIAPLIGPAIGASVGTVIDERDLFVRGVKLQVLGILLAVLSAAAFAAVLRHAHLVPLTPADITKIPEVRERLAPDFLSLAVALGAGIAGALSLTAGVSSAIVGVMIAVALMPPAATVGIGIAWGLPMVSLGSGILALVNVLSINVAAIGVLWYSGYRPERWFHSGEARTIMLKRVAVLLAAIVVLSMFLGSVTYNSFDNATTADAIRADVHAVSTSDEFPSVTLVSVDITFSDGVLFRHPERVIVTVGVPPGGGEQVSGLASRIDDRIDASVGRDVDTQVRYITTERAT